MKVTVKKPARLIKRADIETKAALAAERAAEEVSSISLVSLVRSKVAARQAQHAEAYASFRKLFA